MQELLEDRKCVQDAIRGRSLCRSFNPRVIFSSLGIRTEGCSRGHPATFLIICKFREQPDLHPEYSYDAAMIFVPTGLGSNLYAQDLVARRLSRLCMADNSGRSRDQGVSDQSHSDTSLPPDR